MYVCSERDDLASRLAAMNVNMQQCAAREADAHDQLKACIDLAEQSQMDMSQVQPPYHCLTVLLVCA